MLVTIVKNEQIFYKNQLYFMSMCLNAVTDMYIYKE